MGDGVRVGGVVSKGVEHVREIHEAWAEYRKSDYPASTMVEVRSLVDPDMLIEIEAIAVSG